MGVLLDDEFDRRLDVPALHSADVANRAQAEDRVDEVLVWRTSPLDFEGLTCELEQGFGLGRGRMGGRGRPRSGRLL